MRFCLVSTQPDCGGGEILLTSIADQLDQAGHTVSWITRQGSDLSAQLTSHDQNILHELNGRGRNAHDLFRTRRALQSWVPDVVIMNDTHAVLIAGLATLGLRSKRPVRLAYKHTVFPLRSRLKYRLLTDSVVCVSKAARDKIIAGGIREDEARVIYGGIAPPANQLSRHTRRDFRNELGVQGNTLLVVAVGNLLPVKGHTELIDAVQNLVRDRAQTQHADIRLVIAGEGPQRALLEKKIQHAGLSDHVQLLGFRDDSDRLIEAADLVVHPSRLEGLSLVLIQAQMLRRPIVATAVGGAAEVLDSGHSSTASQWIIQANDPTNIAQKLSQAIDYLRDDTTHSSLNAELDRVANVAKERFDLSTNSTQLVDFAADLDCEKRKAA